MDGTGWRLGDERWIERRMGFEQDWETCDQVPVGSGSLQTYCAQTSADQEPHQYAEISHYIKLLWYNIM